MSAMTLKTVRDDIQRMKENASVVSAYAWAQVFPPLALARRFAAWADAIDAHLAQPAQVDVEKVREVIAFMRNNRPIFGDEIADKLTAALQEEGE